MPLHGVDQGSIPCDSIMIIRPSWLTPEGTLITVQDSHEVDAQRLAKEMGLEVEDEKDFGEQTGYIRIVLPGDLEGEMNIEVFKAITQAQKSKIAWLVEGRHWFHWDITVIDSHGETLQKFNQAIEQNGLVERKATSFHWDGSSRSVFHPHSC